VVRPNASIHKESTGGWRIYGIAIASLAGPTFTNSGCGAVVVVQHAAQTLTPLH
jgi:hypothetical protein